MLPFFDRRRKARYCSSIILNVLQEGPQMFPGVDFKNRMDRNNKVGTFAE